MSDNSSSSKRKRDDKTVSSLSKKTKTDAIPNHQKHHKHWHADGNLVVELDNTFFKLHRSCLAEQATLFLALVETNINDLGEVVSLDEVNLSWTAVSVSDFELLLDAMDDAILYCYNPPSFPTVAAIFRAAFELEFPNFMIWAQEYMEKMWSNDVQHLTSDKIPHATQTVILAQKYNLQNIMKRALYELVRSPGFGQDDTSDPTTTQSLSIETYRMLVKAREELSSMWLGAAINPVPMTPPHQGCASKLNQTIIATALVYESGLFRDYSHDPICGFSALIEAYGEDLRGYCKNCVDKRRKGWMQAKRIAWDMLGVWLELDKPFVPGVRVGSRTMT